MGNDTVSIFYKAIIIIIIGNFLQDINPVSVLSYLSFVISSAVILCLMFPALVFVPDEGTS